MGFLRNELKANGIDVMNKRIDDYLESENEDNLDASLKDLKNERNEDDLLSAHMELINKYKYLEVF